MVHVRTANKVNTKGIEDLIVELLQADEGSSQLSYDSYLKEGRTQSMNVYVRVCTHT